MKKAVQWGLFRQRGSTKGKMNFYIELDTFVDSHNAGYSAYLKRKSDVHGNVHDICYLNFLRIILHFL